MQYTGNIKNGSTPPWVVKDRYRIAIAPLFEGLSGCEVGGLNAPMKYRNTSMEYVDVVSKKEAQKIFPEIKKKIRDEVSYAGDVSIDSLLAITGRTYDFVIANQVIEHVSNPILFLKNLFDGVRDGGYLVISAPDKNLDFDSGRSITDFRYTLASYYLDRTQADSMLYIEFLMHARPEVFETKELFLSNFDYAVKRREHVNVWDKPAFYNFMTRSIELLGIDAEEVFVNLQDGPEALTVFRKAGPGRVLKEDRTLCALSLLKIYWQIREGLRERFPDAKNDTASFTSLLEWAVAPEDAGTEAELMVSKEVLRQYKSEIEEVLANESNIGLCFLQYKKLLGSRHPRVYEIKRGLRRLSGKFIPTSAEHQGPPG